MEGRPGIIKTPGIGRTFEISNVPAIRGATIVTVIATLIYASSLGLTVFAGVISNMRGGEVPMLGISEMLAAIIFFSISTWVIVVVAVALYNSLATKFGGLKVSVRDLT